MHSRVKVTSVQVLSEDWSVLKKTTFDYLRNDGSWQTLTRETYDRGDGACILLYNVEQKSIILTRQFRYPAYVNGLESGMLLEVPAGLLDQRSPEQSIKKELEEETGYVISNIQRLFDAYMSPGSVTEKLFFFAAEYNSNCRAHAGGGNPEEGEDIEVAELSISKAIDMLRHNKIKDAKTIILLQFAALNIFNAEIAL